jgi:hypothetical protein
MDMQQDIKMSLMSNKVTYDFKNPKRTKQHFHKNKKEVHCQETLAKMESSSGRWKMIPNKTENSVIINSNEK